ncbi:F-box/LRR-repeat protein 2-like isoform X14 [Periplaneta americana]|uniref:F-box/LRR-repeat protein 2-like isoform X14 n=1 Tax=Periplaneta americana TaxID=6978 RepID=UPI0037E82F86
MIELLPTEVIQEIFSYLDTNDLTLSVQHVNSRWKALYRDKKLWKDRVFEPDDRMLDEDIVHALKNMPYLRAYVSTGATNTELIINALCTYCDDIDCLDFDGSCILEYSLLVKFTNSFSNIQKLTIPYLEEDNPLQFSQLIGSLQNLTHLGFTTRFSFVPDGVLKPIADGCPSLSHLDLWDNRFKDEDIKYFLTKKQTQLLSFRVECYISLETFKCILQCKNLKNLQYTGIGYCPDETSNNIKLLENLKNLKTLMLWYLTETQFRVVPCFLEAGCLANVTKLGFIAYDLYDLSSVVRNCPQLIDLSVNGATPVLEEGFKHIGNCKNLRSLSFPRCSNVTSKCLEYVAAGCPNLRKLDLSNCCSLNDSLLPSVLKCKNLRVLDISHSGFRGTNFHLIPSHLVQLRELVIYECQVRNRVWDRLLKQMPHLKLTGKFVDSDHEYTFDDNDDDDDDDDFDDYDDSDYDDEDFDDDD